jgi:alanyl-tRNA synthetase
MSIKGHLLAGARCVCYNPCHDSSSSLHRQGVPLSPSERLFWRDAYQSDFTAQVVRRLSVDGRPAVVLDETCFYPTSGGQPHDTGTLNQVPVVDVVELDGAIVHVLVEPLEAEAVAGSIDWGRRHDHMQQHAGQHILSAAFDRLLDAGTVSFHLGAIECTIDIDYTALDPTQADKVEEYANSVVMRNLPIRSHQYTGERSAPQASQGRGTGASRLGGRRR